MTWHEIQTRFRELTAARNSGAPLGALWNGYRDVVQATRNDPPYHLIVPLNLAAVAAKRRGRDAVRILDHGCGGGSTLLYMLALGYEGIHGIDVGGNSAGWNRLLQGDLGLKGDHFFLYDGKKLPFDDNYFDLIISEEVVEHIPDSLIADYYAEGARVLRSDGMAYFTVPHRLVPYDSHTRTWFIHYLPRRVALGVYGMIDEKHRSFVASHLFLRTPGFHRRMLQNFYHASEDVTRKRLISLTKFEYYDGPRGLRHWLGAVSRIPGAGRIAQRMIAPLLMRQTVSRKGPGPLPAVYYAVAGD